MAYNQFAHVRFDGTAKIYDYIIPQGMSVKAGDDALVYVNNQAKTVKVIDVSFTSTCNGVVMKQIAAVVNPEAHKRSEERARQRADVDKQIKQRVEDLRLVEDVQRFIDKDPVLASLCLKHALLS